MSEEEIYEEMEQQRKEEICGYQAGYQAGILNQEGYILENSSINYRKGFTRGYIDGYSHIEKGINEENK